MDNLPVINSNMNELEMEASFSSSSSSSSNSIFDLSDIIALCDRDVRLTTGEIKKILKGIVNRISQIQLGQAIKEGNLSMSGSLSEDKGKEKNDKQDKKAKEDEQEDGEKNNKEFQIKILQKKKSQMANTNLIVTKQQGITKKDKSVEKLKKKDSREKKVKANQQLETNSQIENRIKKLQLELEKVKTMINLSEIPQGIEQKMIKIGKLDRQILKETGKEQTMETEKDDYIKKQEPIRSSKDAGTKKEQIKARQEGIDPLPKTDK